jgi:hypothetical protein
MLASKVTREALESAAAECGVRVEISTLSGSGLRHRVKVLPKVPAEAYTPSGRRKRGTRGDAPYQRTSAAVMFREGARVHAVCWHGFRDFFRAVYRREPGAIFRTALDTWRGAEDFEARFRASGHRNIGAPIAPVCAAEACRCGEEGLAA